MRRNSPRLLTSRTMPGRRISAMSPRRGRPAGTRYAAVRYDRLTPPPPARTHGRARGTASAAGTPPARPPARRGRPTGAAPAGGGGRRSRAPRRAPGGAPSPSRRRARRRGRATHGRAPGAGDGCPSHRRGAPAHPLARPPDQLVPAHGHEQAADLLLGHLVIVLGTSLDLAEDARGLDGDEQAGLHVPRPGRVADNPGLARLLEERED